MEIDRVGKWLVGAERRPLTERPVRPVLVVTPDVGDEHVLEVAAAEDQQPVEALAADAADPALGMGARLRRPYRRFDDVDAFGAEDLVELAAELAVSITDQELRADALVVELHQQVARLLGDPAAVRVGGDPREPDASGRELDEEQDIEAPQEDRVDGEKVARQDARRLPTKKLAPARLEPPRGRLDPRLFQDRPDRARRQLDSEPAQLALDPPVPPARVLAREPHHTLTHLGCSRRASGTPVRIRPAARNQLTVPAQKRRRRYEARPPPCLPWQ